jgi:hypothetical protein
LDPTHPYTPWCIPESCHVRACVRDLGGRGSDGPCMAGKLSKGVDSVRRRQVAAPSGPGGTPMPRLPPAPQPAQATACGSAFRSSAHEAHRRQLLSGTAACSAVTVLQLYPTPNLPHDRLLDGTHAITRNADHAPCCMRRTRPTSDAQQASWQTTRRMAHRGTQGVLKGYSRGTQGY